MKLIRLFSDSKEDDKARPRLSDREKKKLLKSSAVLGTALGISGAGSYGLAKVAEGIGDWSDGTKIHKVPKNAVKTLKRHGYVAIPLGLAAAGLSYKKLKDIKKKEDEDKKN